MRRITKVLYSSAIACSIVAGAVGTAGANNTGQQGCTPGYWKNHTNNWLEDEDGKKSYQPGQAVSDVFPAVASYESLQGTTFLQALQGGGGPGADGAAKILLRAGTAATLNAAHEGLGYPLSRYGADGIFNLVNSALASHDRDRILQLASYLDELNNLGCPLGRGPSGK
jgi:hypothetical protein